MMSRKLYFALLACLPFIWMVTPAISSIDYYGYWHHYNVMERPNPSNHASSPNFMYLDGGFDITNEINDQVNYLYLKPTSFSPSIDTPYNSTFLSRRFIDGSQKQIILPLPIKGNYPGTNTSVIAKSSCVNGYDRKEGLYTWSFLQGENLHEMQIARFCLMWTGWEVIAGNDTQIRVKGVVVEKPSNIPESEFKEDFMGIGEAIKPFWEHISFIDFVDEPYTMFPAPANVEDDWLFHLVESANTIANFYPDLSFLSQIPHRVNFNPTALIPRVYNNGQEIDVIPDNIDFVETDPYFQFIFQICSNHGDEQPIEYFQHDFCGSGLTLWDPYQYYANLPANEQPPDDFYKGSQLPHPCSSSCGKRVWSDSKKASISFMIVFSEIS